MDGFYAGRDPILLKSLARKYDACGVKVFVIHL
jgi:hypothetical protein